MNGNENTEEPKLDDETTREDHTRNGQGAVGMPWFGWVNLIVSGLAIVLALVSFGVTSCNEQRNKEAFQRVQLIASDTRENLAAAATTLQQIQQLSRGTNETIATVDGTLQQVQEVADETKQTLSTVGEFARLGALAAGSSNTFANGRNPYIEEIEELIRRIDETAGAE